MTKKKSTKGSKGKYRDWITYEGLTKIEGYARDGLSNEQIAKNMGIHEATLYEWIKRFPQLNESIKKGKEVVDREVENALFKSSIGFVEKETGEYIKPNPTAQIFWLKNRKPEVWNDRKQVEHSGGINNNITAFDNVSTEDLKSIVEEYKNAKRNE